MTNDEDSKDMALFEHALRRATRAARTASKSIWRTIANRGGKRVEGNRETAQPNTAAVERLAVVSVLFHPQPGSRPMHFGGRVLQMQVLQGVVDALAAQGGLLRLPAEAPLPEVQDVALHGARGLGKTALGLRWLKERAEDAGLHVIDCPAAFLKTLGDLYAVTLGEPVPNTDAQSKLDAGQVGGQGTHLASSDQRTKEFPGMRPAEWLDRLRELCQRRPTLMVVDEAHVLDLDVAHVLLNATQSLRGASPASPFALVLMGTPDLKRHLMYGGPDHKGARSTFWNRLGKGDMRIGLLSQDEAEEALAVPLQSKPHGLGFDPEAVRSMAQESDGYPYFVQLWGQQAETAARAGSERVGMAEVEQARVEVERMREDFYVDRREELDERRLLGAATLLAPHLSDLGVVLTREDARAILLPAIVADDDKMAHSALNELLELGILAREARGGGVQAGIPSFMDYLERLASAK